MPKADGFEVARQLRQDPRLRQIPLVAVTTFAMRGDKDKVMAAGFDGYIGYDFLRMHKADPEQGHIPFVIISSTVWRETDPSIALPKGASKFILRPIGPEALIAEIEACLPKQAA